MRFRKKIIRFLHLLGERQIKISEKYNWKKKLMLLKNRSMYGKEDLLTILSILSTDESPVLGRK